MGGWGNTKAVPLNWTPESPSWQWESWEYREAWDGKPKMKPLMFNGTLECLF